MAVIATRWEVRFWLEVDLETGEVIDNDRAEPFHVWRSGFRVDPPGEDDTAQYSDLEKADRIARRYLEERGEITAEK